MTVTLPALGRILLCFADSAAYSWPRGVDRAAGSFANETPTEARVGRHKSATKLRARREVSHTSTRQTFKSREILDEVNALLEKIAMNAARDTASSRIRTGKATPSDLKYAFRPTDDVARNGADGGGLAACAELLCRRKGTPSPNVASSPPPSRFGHSAAD